MGTPEIHLYTRNIGIKKITEIKMCDFFVFFQSDIEEKNRPNTINIWFGMIVNWSRTCFNFNFTRDEFVYVFFFCQM